MFLSFSAILLFISSPSINCGQQTFALQHILTNCSQLKYLHYSDNSVGQFLSFIHNLNLCKLHIESGGTNITQSFMAAVSATGSLVHIVLYVRSGTSEGVNILIANSTDLLKLAIIVRDGILGRNNVTVYLNDFKAGLEKEFFPTDNCSSLAYNITQMSQLDHNYNAISFKQYIDR